MTVSSSVNKVTYSGNSATTVFPVNYYFLENSHLQVILVSNNVETIQTITSQYTVTGAGNPAGGSVTMLTPPPTGTQLIIVRNVPATQETDYLANDPFPAESHERALDKLTMLVQQNSTDIDRALKIPLSSLATTSTELPVPSANKLLAWNSNASAITNFDPLSVISIVGQQASFSNVFTGNGVTVNFTLDRTPGNANAVDVSINGVTQVPNVDYILNGDILTFTTAPPQVASQILARYTEVFAEPNGDAANVRYLPAGSGAVVTNVQAKLRETVSVKDFGAVGDGVTDDTVAIQAALNANLAINFGSADNIYIVSDELIVQSQSFLYAEGATIRQTTNVKSIFNIDGKTNIYIEGFVFDDTGAGYVTNDANPNAAVFGGVGTDFVTITRCKFTNVTYAALRFQDSNTITVTENIVIGPGVATLPASTNLRCYGILFDTDCDKFICSNNQVTGTTIGIRIEKSSNGACTGNVVYDIPGQHGFYIGAACNNLTISGNTVTQMALIGIKVQAENSFANINQINVTGNSVVSCNQGITFTNGASGNAETAKIVNSIIEGNVIRDITTTGINVQNTLQAIITNNTISECGFSGINISACVLIDISLNFITGCALSGIRDQAVSSSVRIIDNIIRNVATAGTVGDRFGIFIQALDAYTINGNSVTSATATMEYALYMAGGDQTNTIVESNYLFDATGAALRVASTATSFLSFKNNALYGTTQSVNSSALPSVASAATITLPTQDAVVRITGTTNITTILNAGHTGHRITLVFDDVLTVVRGSNVLVASNFTTSANDTLTLVCDGNNWLEVSRSAN
jgi:hypothetical protein